MENKNLFVAMALFALIYLGGQILFPPQKDNAGEAPVSEKVTVASVEKETPTVLPVVSLNSALVDVPETFFELSNDFVTYKISSHGGSIVAATLNKYFQETTDEEAHYGFSSLGRGSRSISYVKADGSLSFLEEVQLVRIPEESDGTYRLSLSGQTLSGLPIRMTYTLGSTYEIDFVCEIFNNSTTPVQGSFVYGIRNEFDPDIKIGSYDFLGTVTMVADDTESKSTKDLAKEIFTPKEPVGWSAFADKYFMAALVPESNPASLQVSSANGIVNQAFSTQSATVGANSRSVLNLQYYFGPKDVDILSRVGSGLERAVNFGWFSFFAKPIFHFLKFIHTYVPNWGLSIILLTILIKLAFWPLTDKSYSSMKAMQTLQPEMLKLREKYKNDKMRMNQEIMELYKKHRLNPAAGCLPMLVQLPVFIALYNVLLNAVDLRHAPFIFWITDLSVKDPLYITPLIMGGTMFIQQKLTPTAANMEPMQAKMMQFLPVVFTFLFLNFPAGLVIYWLVNNLLTILQQVIIKRRG